MTAKPIPRDVINRESGEGPRMNGAGPHPNGTGPGAVENRRRTHGLNEGELDVLFLMLQGEYPQEIAGYLGVAVAEVAGRQLSIREKMGARSATEAAVMAIKQQVFPSSRPPLRVVRN